MKATTKQLFVELTPIETAAINGGRHGADDGINHDLYDDKGGLRAKGVRRNDDGPFHA
jgi:hypothetical protein